MEKLNTDRINTIFWDWNGTLLNDTRICIDIMNLLLERRNIPKLTLEKYRSIFTFPVKKYYESAGFDFNYEEFEKPATEFIDIYNEQMYHAPLFDEVLDVLGFFAEKNFRQLIISAMKHKELIECIKDKKLTSWFDEIRGIADHYANGKQHIATSLIEVHSLYAENICLIGDTLHDYEVAKEIGCHCILVANGHQSFERLKQSGCLVVNELHEVKPLFANRVK